MADSVILEEDLDEDYEPTQEEIDEYAKWLGMNIPDDNDLLWIATEALKAPLPENWKPCKTDDADIYYFNFQTGESTWDHPCDDYYQKTYQQERAKKLRRIADAANKPAEASRSLASSKDSRSAPSGASSLGSLGRAAPMAVPAKLAPIGSLSRSLEADAPRPTTAPPLAPTSGAASADALLSTSLVRQGSLRSGHPQPAQATAPSADAALERPSSAHPRPRVLDHVDDEADSYELSVSAGISPTDELARDAEQLASAQRVRAALAEAEREVERVRAAGEQEVLALKKEAARRREDAEAAAAAELREPEAAHREKFAAEVRSAREAAAEVARAEAQRTADDAVREAKAVAEASEREARVSKVEAEASKREAEASRRETEAVSRELDAVRRELDAAQRDAARHAAELAEARETAASATAELAKARDDAASTMAELAEARAAAASATAKATSDVDVARRETERLRLEAEEAAATVREQAHRESAAVKEAAMAEAVRVGEEAARAAAALRADASAEAALTRSRALDDANKSRDEAANLSTSEAAARARLDEETVRVRTEAERIIAAAREEAAKLREDAIADASRRAADAEEAARAQRVESDKAVERSQQEVTMARDAAIATRAQAEAEARRLREGAVSDARAHADRLAASVLEAAKLEAANLRAAAEAEAAAVRAAAAQEAEGARAELQAVRAAAHAEAAATRAAAVAEARVADLASPLTADKGARVPATPSSRRSPPASAARTAPSPSPACAGGGAVDEQQDTGIDAATKARELLEAASALAVGDAAPAAVVKTLADVSTLETAFDKENTPARNMTGNATHRSDGIGEMLRHQKEQVAQERVRLRQARSSINARARDLRARQERVLAMQAEWKADMRKVSALVPGDEQDAITSMMRESRRILERETARLNEETEEVQASIRWVKEWEASLAQLDLSYREMLAASSGSASPVEPAALNVGAVDRRRIDELRADLDRIAGELDQLVSPVKGSVAASPAGRAAVRGAGAVLWSERAAQRERVAQLMQHHSQWLRKIRSEVAPMPIY